MTERDIKRVFEWFSYSHWGMFRLALFTAPEWFVWGACHDVANEDIEWADAPALSEPPQ